MPSSGVGSSLLAAVIVRVAAANDRYRLMRLPISIRSSSKCKRCGMRYPEHEAVCPHCDGLSDEQLRRIRLRHQNDLAGNSNLGRLLFYIAGLLLVVMVIYFLKQ